MPFPNIPNLPNLSNLFGRLPRFGDLLRNYRTLRGASIEQVAATVGLAPSALRDIEAGKRPAPSKEIVKGLADAPSSSSSSRISAAILTSRGSRATRRRRV